MIIVDNVYKRYKTDHGLGKWVLQGASFVIPPNTNVGLVGLNGSGKSTLLRIIGGVDQPSRGRVERHCRVSWPMGLAGGLQSSLTGRQNTKFLCRIHGHEDEIAEKLAFVQEFAEIGDAFDEPTKTYSSGMNARLKFALSLAFDFDVYISDELTAVGDANFKKKAKEAFRQLTGKAGLIMVSHSDETLTEFCQAGVWLNEGRAHWFDDINNALAAYREHCGLDQTEEPQQQKLHKAPISDESLAILQQGREGTPVTLDPEAVANVIRQANRLGIVLWSAQRLRKEGYQIKEGIMPLLKRRVPGEQDKVDDLYDLHSQCVKAGNDHND